MLITYFIMCSEITASACGPKYSTVCQKMAMITTAVVSVCYHTEMDSHLREIAIKKIQDAIDSTGRNGSSCHNSLKPRNQAITMDIFFCEFDCYRLPISFDSNRQLNSIDFRHRCLLLSLDYR